MRVQFCQLLEEGAEEPGPSSSVAGVLHVCLQRAGRLELWLQEARRSLVTSTMQENVEQQLLTCQEMFLEIEQKVKTLSSLGHVSDLQPHLGAELGPELGPELGAELGPDLGPELGPELGPVGSQQEAAELLSSKLELLKSNLVSFQQVLQDRQEEERTTNRKEPQLVPDAERHLESRLRRSSSVQEIFSSPRNKLLRQSSLQQQKELEQELSEQRGLTQAIARQGSRARLHSPESEGHTQLSPGSPPAEADVVGGAVPSAWDGLHSRLLALEESWLLPPSEGLVRAV
ncbi:nesprin-2 [Pleuronectes platessa]|uniref:nesprin-2 n=1 Tax=Pleuronectes platessa TaxID=8262 RepID=UPI00232A5290|nr:nesprin-2 [Pleuronectes platessa]